MTSDGGGMASGADASGQDGTYPRPQLVRPQWRDLCGEWSFAYDDQDEGLRLSWYTGPPFEGVITVPFPPESPASGIADTGFHPTVWYQRWIRVADLEAAGYETGKRLILHFGAVDYRCQIWMNGQRAGEHEGGQSPFSIDITGLLAGDEQSVVVRAEDDPADGAFPRGKQDWRLHPHSVWYHRTTGIWQPVWLEAIPELSITSVHWESNLLNASVDAGIGLSHVPPAGSTVSIALSHNGVLLGSTVVAADSADLTCAVSITAQRNGQSYQELLWSPENPRLLDAAIELATPDGGSVEIVRSYLGLRSVGIANGHFLLNDRPYFLRSVLNQGYWPQSHLAAPSPDALRADAQLIKDLGFNATRLHQKFEDPRFLYWADRLGILVWAEAPSAYAFNATSVERMVREWVDIVRRDRSHPSIVTWVPLNESWGVQHIAHDDRMRHYALSLVHLTKALDPTRLVISNDGWEHVASDILSIHDYEPDGDVLAARYADKAVVDLMLTRMGPAGRRMTVGHGSPADAPVMLTEFGGVAFSQTPVEDAWGYSAAGSADEYAAHLGTLFGAVQSSSALAGYCYTQLADTGQETNGLVAGDRKPKLAIESIRRIVTGKDHRQPE